MSDEPSIDAELAAQLCELGEGELSDRELWDFVRESNAIEGIHRPPSYGELNELARFLALDTVTIDDLVQFVSVYQPDAVLRDRPEVPGVRVGNHVAPRSGPAIRKRLDLILGALDILTPKQAHHNFETLHPFTDGNGRSGRALWLWMMRRQGKRLAPMGFLQSWYYQSLAEGR